MPGKRAGIIGAGLCGLTAAIRLAQRGVDVDLFEAAPQAGGRTRSFFEAEVQEWVDNGPHLLSGAYRDTIALLDEAGATDNLDWQSSLALPLWEAGRGSFTLQPNPRLPLALALPLACARLPGHGWGDIPALLRLATCSPKALPADTTVHDWFANLRLPENLAHDLLEPLCLGAMNEGLTHANAASFARVLDDAFASHASARLGWFNKPLSEALVTPLVAMAESLGVRMHTSCRVQGMRESGKQLQLLGVKDEPLVDALILTQPLRSLNQWLNRKAAVRTQCIRNVHLWFDDMPALTHPFIGGIGTTGQWWFDVSSQMTPLHPSSDQTSDTSLRHLCAVISADDPHRDTHTLCDTLCDELAVLTESRAAMISRHSRIVAERHATVSVLPEHAEPALPRGLVTACEAPVAGGLPATIEDAVRRGNEAAERCYLQYFH